MADPKESNGLAGNIQEGGDNHQFLNEDGSPGTQTNDMQPLQMDTSRQDPGLSAKSTSEGLKVIIVSSITFAIGITVALIITIYVAPPEVPPHGAVSCEIAECAEMGTAVLKDGGSATDAAVTASLCVGVINSLHAGIGGGAVVMARSHKDNLTEVFTGLESAPQSLPKDFDPDKAEGASSVAVPGALKALAEAHAKHGVKTWKELVMPVAELARGGFNVSLSLGSELAGLSSEQAAAGNLAFQKFYFRDGRPLSPGQTVSNAKLADLLERVAEEGVDYFYLNNSATWLSQLGSDALIRDSDLFQYNAKLEEPTVSTFLNMSVETCGAPCAGPQLLLLLNMMDGYLADGYTPDENFTQLTYHRLAESLKFAYGQGSLLADPDFVSLDVNMTSLAFAAELRNRTSDDSTQPDASYYGSARPDSSHVTHVSVIGPNDDHASVSLSLGSAFGSRQMVSGFLLNDRLKAFSKTGNNRPEAGKRPASAMVPVLVHARNRPCGHRVAMGAGHGNSAIAGSAQTLVHLMVHGRRGATLADAVNATRIDAPLSAAAAGVTLTYEADLPPSVVAFLNKVGHKTAEIEAGGHIAQVVAVAKINETLWPAQDWRNPDAAADVF